jgi:hypothetical protein
VQQADRYEELISNLSARQSQQIKIYDDNQQAMQKQILQQNHKLESQDARLSELSRSLLQQTNTYNELIGNLGIKVEQ